MSFFNGVLGAQNPEGCWWTYNTPMDGERKASAHDIVFQASPGSPALNCCSVNGPRGLGMLSEWTIMTTKNGIVLNYYGPAEFSVPAPSGLRVRLKQTTDYPRTGRIELRVEPERNERFVLNLRIPSWSRHTTGMLNGKRLDSVRPGTYFELDREWVPGEVVELNLDMAPRLWIGERESQDKLSVYQGPLLLAYDPRFDGWDPTKLPDLDLSRSPSAMVESRLAPPPVVLLRFSTQDGQGITLCDFASAGMAGNRYVSWLPARDVKPIPFTRANPLRAVWPGETGGFR